ncbi:hepatitis A virus cellular receptor 2 homolog isoform X2 [Hemicordylus capensis]|uniref:hepatitis A virus cellular receptor 2 homolog isoform X2 n=1 Tax=Hemicordylus capensis TaxID=884348 RepID=UPI0023041D77|nr:hepatitis A virus cellular receptor 2 homolog isoform X2 [Hemicordylus capensis]
MMSHDVLQKLEKSEAYFGNESHSFKYTFTEGTRQSSDAISIFTMFPCLYLEWMLVVVFTGSLATHAETIVRGMVGQNINLPCHYSTAKHGTTSMCWGRGSCPHSWCSSPILWIDEKQVTVGQSSKYQVMGDVNQGNVSLTIVNVTENDEGRYCCRVEIPGWFNDHKSHVKVVIEKDSGPVSNGVPATTHSITSDFTLEPRLTASTESPPDNLSLLIPTLLKEQKNIEHSKTGMYIGIGTCAGLLIIVATLLLLKWHLHKKQKIINFASPVIFSNSETGGIQHSLESGIHAQENIYVLD